MNKFRIFISVALLQIFCFSLIAENKPLVTEPFSEEKIETEGWVAHPKNDYKRKLPQADVILHAAFRSQWKVLDDYVEKFGTPMIDGSDYREWFYYMFGSYSRINKTNPEKYFDTLLNQLEKWQEVTEHKGVADIARAGLYKNIAWHYRGGGYADTVKEEGWQKFFEYIKLSEQELATAHPSARKDPHFFRITQTIAMAKSWKKKSALNAFKAGQKIQPDYITLYFQLCYNLQPRWNGSSEVEWHRALEKALEVDGLTEDQKSSIYGQVCRANLRGKTDYEDDKHNRHGIDLERFLTGLKIKTKQVPESSDWPTVYLYHAWKCRSEKHMKEALELMNLKYLPATFTRKERFKREIMKMARVYPNLNIETKVN